MLKILNSNINPFGNSDEEIPELLAPSCSKYIRLLLWWIRNPLHNFTHHWIGFHGSVFSTRGKFLGYGINTGFTRSRLMWFPLLSYRGKYVEGYIGWRFNGAFGIALRKANSKKVR